MAASASASRLSQATLAADGSERNNDDSGSEDTELAEQRADSGIDDCGDSVAIDETGAIRLDRDPLIFRWLLNLMRGYRSVVPPSAMLPSVRSDVEYYGLEQIWRERFPPLPRPTFYGPGSSVGGQSVTSGHVIAIAGQYFHRGVEQIDFYIDQCDAVAVGVVSRHLSDLCSSVLAVRGCAMYSHTGNVHHNFPHPVCEETGSGFGADFLITVTADLDERRLQWARNGTVVAMAKIDEACGPVAFAVSLSRASAVTISPSETDV